MSHSDWYHLEKEAGLPSPSLLLFRERIQHNLREMLRIAGNPSRLRPHVKTHKMAELIRRQIALGISKFKAATLAEAEMCADAGAKDVLLAMPCVEGNATRLATLARMHPSVRLGTIADHPDTVRFLSHAAFAGGVSIGVYLELDCGMGRTGITPGAHALKVVESIQSSPGLHFKGLHAYDGHIHTTDLAERTHLCDAAFTPILSFRQELIDAGIPVDELVAGGSPTFPIHAAYPDRTLSPGTTVLWDFGYADHFPDLNFLPAAVLLTRVISKPAADRITVDLGHKAVAAENPHPRVRFLEFGGEEPKVLMQSEEHLVLQVDDASQFAIGQTLHGIPRHICPTVALHGEAHLIDGGIACDIWPVTARNRSLTI